MALAGSRPVRGRRRSRTASPLPCSCSAECLTEVATKREVGRMHSFHPSVWSVARSPQYTQSIRYAVQRFGELLDPHAHFAASASFTLDPLTAVLEFLELARAYQLSSGTNPSPRVMGDAVRRTRSVLSAERNLAGAYGATVRSAIDSLTDAVDFAAAASQKINRTNWLDMKVGQAARGSVRALRLALEDPAAGYREILKDRIRHTCEHEPVDEAAWRQFDDDLRFAASLALADGRDGKWLAVAIAKSVLGSISDAGAANALVDTLTSPMEPHVVALRLIGVRRPLNVTGFTCRWVQRGDRWDQQARPGADVRLSRFVTAQRDCAVIVTEVDAHDAGHARTLGTERVERLADQYRARHRAYAIQIDTASLVLRLSDSRVIATDAPSQVLPEAKARLSRPEPRLEQSFRYAALARSERAPVIQILHSWIALETLARGTGITMRPYPFVMRYVSSLLSIHGVRNGLAATWHVASRAGRRSAARARWAEVEGWLGVVGVRRQLPDLNRWLDLMRLDPADASVVAPVPLDPTASVADAAAVLQELVADFPPFVRQAIATWRWRLAVGSRLSNWCDEIEHRAEATLGRMYVIRNSSVHTALTQVRASEQLAHAALNITDTVYEVLPRWLKPSDQTWEPFDRIERRSTHVRKAWNSNRSPKLNADKLTTPGGDGLAR